MTCGNITAQVVAGAGHISPMTCCTGSAPPDVDPPPAGYLVPNQQQQFVSVPGTFFGQFGATAPPTTLIVTSKSNPSPTPRGFVDQFIDKPQFVSVATAAVTNANPPGGTTGSTGTPHTKLPGLVVPW